MTRYPRQSGSTTIPVPTCHVRSCDQVVTYRSIPYDRALDIVEKEIYLSDRFLEDIDDDNHEVGRSFRDATFVFLVPLVLAAAIGFIIFSPISYDHSNRRNDPIVIPDIGQPAPFLPQPGTLRGGGFPIPDTVNAVEAMAMVPERLQAVSIFPPFGSSRTSNATCVIFSESDRTSLRAWRNRRNRRIGRPGRGGVNNYFSLINKFTRRYDDGGDDDRRFDFLHRRYKRENYRDDDYDDYDLADDVRYNDRHHGLGDILDGIHDHFRYKAKGIHDHFDHKLDHLGHAFRRHHEDFGFDDDTRRRRRTIDRLYGLKCRVRYVDNEPCTFGVTCDEIGNDLPGKEGHWDRDALRIIGRNRPKCKTKFVGGSGC